MGRRTPRAVAQWAAVPLECVILAIEEMEDLTDLTYGVRHLHPPDQDS